MVTDILAFVRADYGDLITDADLDLDVCLSAAGDDEPLGISVRHAWTRPRLTILVRHAPADAISFSSLAVRAAPFLIFDAIVSRALRGLRDDFAGLDPFRDGWLGFLARRSCHAWAATSTAFPNVFLRRCSSRADDVFGDRARHEPVIAYGESAALYLQSLLRDVLGNALAPRATLEASRRLALASRSRLDTNDLMLLLKETGLDQQLRNRVLDEIRNLLTSGDFLGAIDHMIDLVESFAS
jgi:hypothetical protein